MKNLFELPLIGLLFVSSFAVAQPIQSEDETKFHNSFTEHFSKSYSDCFYYNYRKSGYDYRYFSGYPSLSEKDTEIMMYRIDPEDPAGVGKGPEIISGDYTFYGTYSARLRVPKAAKAQPDVGAVVGYFTYNVDPEFGQSEIDWMSYTPFTECQN